MAAKLKQHIVTFQDKIHALTHIYTGVFLDMKFAEVISQLVKDKLITNVKEHNPEHFVTGSLTKSGEEFIKNVTILQDLELKFEMRKNEVKNADEARQKAETYYQVTVMEAELVERKISAIKAKMFALL
jgi:predicted transcriptional regulator